MATLAQLEEQKRELEERLDGGDVSAEAALARVDAAIRARRKTIQHSQKRLQAVKNAVSKGVPVAEAKAVKRSSKIRKKLKQRASGPINRFD
ncbi:MAG: hypothetical protein P8Y61_11420 [Gammaproteobacteria bacterium]